MLRPLLLLAAFESACGAPLVPTTPATPTAPTSHVLLVLRAACFTSQPKEHFARSLEDYAAVTGLTIGSLLPFEETCGAGWRGSARALVARAARGGGAVAAAGALGAARCAALAATGARVRGGACGAGAARARALARLAAALGWRRAVLPRGCGPGAAAAAASALVAQGLAVAWAYTDDLPFKPDVVVMTVCGKVSPLPLQTATAAAAAADGATLLLLAIPAEEAAADHDDHSADLATVNGNKSNINLDVNMMPYVEMGENLSFSSFPSSLKLSVYHTLRGAETFSSLPNLVKDATPERNKGKVLRANEIENYSALSSENREGHNAGGRDPNATTGKLKVNNEPLNEKQTNFTNKVKDEPFVESEEYAALVAALPGRRIIVLVGAPEGAVKGAAGLTAEGALTAALRQLARPPPAARVFTVYAPAGAAAAGARRWRGMARVVVRRTAVDLELTRDLTAWTVRRTPGAPGTLGNLQNITVWLMVGVMLMFLLLVTSFIARSVGWRCCGGGGGAGGRRRGSAVLAAAHFQFPAEEARVDSGMESMLSCWLQRLHEFGGPELPAPSATATATANLGPLGPLGPRASQPSSTCSITRIAPDKRTTYKGDPVLMKYLEVPGGGGGGGGGLELKRKALDVLLVMRNINHENLNPFIGCLCGGGGGGGGGGEESPRSAALVWAHGGRGTLEDVLVADDIRLDWTFRLSLLTDLVRGARALHASALRVHGRLSSRCCLVDARWVLRISDYGLPSFYRAQGLPSPRRTARDMLWTAPELLRAASPPTVEDEPRATQPGDVFSFAIIMQEVIVRGEPYCMLSLTPEEIIEKLSRPPPLIRPSVSMGAAPPEAVSVMRQCWSEAPDLRPAFDDLYEIFRHMHRGRKINIVDSMFEMLEKYSNNLEELIKERTEQLDMEKKKTEQLLNRMLPRSVAERLLLGSAVEPEEFAEVSIYFSDIVGFTELAARSTPVQVVDLLNDLYTSFDAAIEQHRVYKVETIGDAYMVVGGLPARCADHAERVATMALHLLHVAGRFRIRHLPARPLHVRIGLHSGPCCAGVVGRTMPRYCLFGDTVNTAARMESTGAAWRVQLSARTARRLAASGGGYRLRERGRLRVKGKGVMRTYWLLGKDGFDKPLPTPPPLETEDALLEAEHEHDEFEAEDDLSLEANDKVGVEGRDVDEPVPVDIPFAPDRHGWQRSGTVSADSSPPAPPRAPLAALLAAAGPAVPAPAADLTAPYSRYRCSSASGARVLRRQWSLERGEALAVACVRPPPAPPPHAAAPGVPPGAPAAPLALQVAPARPAPPRYRTRPDAP